ncbi:MAG: glutaredoxin domain-containing protein, partial [Enterobacterales bacterium endosymbiont of Blomia tropicalis]|uniref:glutaredoxin domain-containing protein n=1 Tax=Mixta mediterraneensis TaxID=2758443 RepID=UPI0025A8C0C4
SMIIENNVVKKLFAEEEGSAPDPYQVSDAKSMLKFLDPQAKMPSSCVIFTQSTCPYCKKALKSLSDRGVKYVEVSLDDDQKKATVLAALGKTTVPQIFIDGKHVGGSDDLEHYFAKQ